MTYREDLERLMLIGLRQMPDDLCPGPAGARAIARKDTR